MAEKRTFRDRLSILKASVFGASYQVRDGVRLDEQAFNGLLASSGMNPLERLQALIKGRRGDTSSIQTHPRRRIPLPGRPRYANDIVDITVGKGWGQQQESRLVDEIAFLGHHVKHRRIRSHLGGFFLLSGVSAAARLTYLALDIPLPNLIDVQIPIDLPKIGEPHITLTYLTTAAIGLATTGIVQFLIRKPLHERKYLKKRDNIRAYARRIGPFIKD